MSIYGQQVVSFYSEQLWFMINVGHIINVYKNKLKYR